MNAPARLTQSAPVTLLMPVYNRAAALQAVMPSYLNQAYLDKIVLVDDGSDDTTPQVMAEWKNQSSVFVQVIRHPRQQGQPQARLSALAAADTEWVLFGEDDVALAPDYVATLLREAQTYDADIIAGRLVNVAVGTQVDLARLPALAADLPTPVHPSFDLNVFRADYHAQPPQAMLAPFLHTVALIRRAVFEQVSFDPLYGGNAVREETDFYLAAGAAGYKCMFTPATVCYHLRGPLANSGGQRMSRPAMEYWNLINTRRLVTKHWPYLCSTYGFAGTPTTWMLGYIRQRYRHVAGQILATRTLQPKDRA